MNAISPSSTNTNTFASLGSGHSGAAQRADVWPTLSAQQVSLKRSSVLFWDGDPG